MADLVCYGNSERDVEQALIALKKGTQLIKYSRKGRPKLCPFRISPDAATLIWYSHGEERNLKISSVLKIIPGQRTPVFRRFLRPEKDYLSFSLIYNNGERSLDLICKDKFEAEVWFAGLQDLISAGRRNRRTKSDISYINDSFDLAPNGHGFGAALDFTRSSVYGRTSVDPSCRDSSVSSDVAPENMQLRTSTGDGFRLSVSSTPSNSSQGSGPDDIESLGDVYVWGEVWSDGGASDGSGNTVPVKTDVLIPKPLESSIVLDVHQIACGVRHFALVTRQGEVFTWGEEAGGRLGHGTDKDLSCPRLVEYLAVTNVDSVACGEYHTCAVSSSGDLYSWGDGSYNAQILGHGTNVSHRVPKRVSRPLEGLQVLSIACGSWHSALTTSNGKLFTFGDGAFGVLGHGDRESVAFPREVQFLSGSMTIKVACGVWHTAAIVEAVNQSGTKASPRKLFTWGDGYKNRLGHGNKEAYLLPTCVSALTDYNFKQIACGHNMTVALTTSGHVFTMGSSEYGQLGNCQSDGALPCLVQERLVGEYVEEISCGANHIAVLTSRSEAFTWGRGANGRLGHGDSEDRVCPTLVESLKDKHVKNISCGASSTASICIHKWVSGVDQSVCSGCRQAFGFTRKRHNCYNCGLVHCHACSSKKALRAALAPTPGKPHRVCDSCYAKLKASEASAASVFNKKSVGPRYSVDSKEQFDRGEARSSKLLLFPALEDSIKYKGMRPVMPGVRYDSFSRRRAPPQVPSLLQLKDIAFPSTLSALQNALKPAAETTPLPPPPPQPTVNMRPVSSYSRRPSPPRSTTPVFSRSVVDSLKKTNELLNREVTKLQGQIGTLKQKCDSQDAELHRLQRRAQEVALLATQESSRSSAAKDVVKIVATQLKDISEKLPPEVLESENFKAMHAQVETYLKTKINQGSDFSLTLAANLDHKIEEHLNGVEVSDIPNNGESRVIISDPSQSSSHETLASKSEEEKQLTEHFEPGVYVTFIQLQNGVKSFRRVRFSKRRFNEHQAEDWWKENKDRLFNKYSVPMLGTAPTEKPSMSTTAGDDAEAALT